MTRTLPRLPPLPVFRLSVFSVAAYMGEAQNGREFFFHDARREVKKVQQRLLCKGNFDFFSCYHRSTDSEIAILAHPSLPFGLYFWLKLQKVFFWICDAIKAKCEIKFSGSAIYFETEV